MYFKNNANVRRTPRLARDAQFRRTAAGRDSGYAVQRFCSRLHAAPPWSPKTGVAGRMLQWNIGPVNQRDDVFLADFSDFPQGLAAIAFALGQMDYGSHFPNE